MKSSEKYSDSSGKSALNSGVRINKNLAKALYAILGLVTIALLIITIYASASGEGAVYPVIYAVIFILLGGAIAVSIVVFNPKKSIYDLGFYLLHIGIVIFVSSMMIFSLKGSSHYVTLPVLSSVTEDMELLMKENYGWNDNDIDRLKSYRNQIGTDNGEIFDLGFNFRMVDFETQYYEDGESIKHYEGKFEFFLSDGTVETVPLTVNNPLYRSGWKIYLMNVGASPYGYEQVNLMLKKDPTEFLSVAGIILIIFGTFMMCILPEKSLNVIGDTKKRGGVIND